MNRKNGEIKMIVKIRFYELVRKLREDGLSWANISKYLARYHNFEIDRSYLKICFEKITAEQKRGGG